MIRPASPRPTFPLSTIALEQLEMRRRRAQRVVNRAGSPREHLDRVMEMNARLAPWLAAAVLCADDPGRIHPDLAAAIESRVAAGLEQPTARALVAMELCDPAEMRAAIARARDESLTTTHAAALAALADHLACPAPQRIAA